MPALAVALFGFASCVFYGAIFTIGYFNSTPDGSWHTAWTILLLLTAVGATEYGIFALFLLIRRKLGYKEEFDG
ncbi:MAG: hypothetical protein Athens041674_426 [Parcubacteria group bacterium Athens0416_74]|nr:MAG: hypothetical protein Athens041674_426 [Parcubacteria group bacterium Athens0416_74]